MKKILTLVSAALIFVGVQAHAADANTNIAVVNVGQILHASQQVKDATKQIRDKFSPQQKKIKDQQDQLQAQVAKLEKNKSVMSDADKKKAAADIAKKRQDMLKEIGEFQKALSTAQSDTMKKIFNQLNGVIKSVAQKDHYDIVLDSQFVVYTVKGNDITDEVAKAFAAAPKSAPAKK